MRIRSAVVALTVLLPAAATAQRSTDSAVSKWSDQIATGRWVRVSNLNGKITVGQSTSGKVEVTSTKHWRRGNPDDVKIVAKKDGEDVVICALWGKQEDCEDRYDHNDRRHRSWNDWDNDDNDVYVDFAVLIPKGTKLRSSSVNGGQTITGATSDVEASTVNGELRIDASGGGPVHGSGVNGRVYGRISGGTVDQPIDFSTVNGSVVLEVPENLGAEVTMTTVNGSLDSDFPLMVRGRIDPRHLTVHVGNATNGPRVSLTTVNGSVELRKR
jgi:hypothetical protein